MRTEAGIQRGCKRRGQTTVMWSEYVLRETWNSMNSERTLLNTPVLRDGDTEIYQQNTVPPNYDYSASSLFHGNNYEKHM